VNTALSNPEVQARLEGSSSGASRKLINYILPVGLYVSEIPMNPVDGGHNEHYPPRNYDTNIYKIIFTRAELRNNRKMEGKDILLNTIKRVPVLEVQIDLSQNHVAEIKNPPTIVMYENIPVPLW